MGAEHPVKHARELIGVGARAGSADGQLLGEEILELGDAGIASRHADADLVIGAADPAEFLRVERIALSDQERVEGDAAADGADRGAVLRRHPIEEIGKPQAARALDVLLLECRITLDVGV